MIKLNKSMCNLVHGYYWSKDYLKPHLIITQSIQISEFLSNANQLKRSTLRIYFVWALTFNTFSISPSSDIYFKWIKNGHGIICGLRYLGRICCNPCQIGSFGDFCFSSEHSSILSEYVLIFPSTTLIFSFFLQSSKYLCLKMHISYLSFIMNMFP